MNLFLRAKHWQLFLVCVAFPMVLGLISYIVMFIQMFDNPYDPDPFAMFDAMGNMMIFITVISLISSFTLYSWFWSIGTGLQAKLPEGMTMNIGRFKAGILVAAISGVLVLVIYSLMLNTMESMISNSMDGPSSEPPEGLIAFVVAIIVMMPLSILAMVAMVHTLFFVAKTLKSVELQKETKFGDFVGEFFLLWFYFVGFWILQPKINRMSSDDWNRPPPVPPSFGQQSGF